jgi:hypothetical protein
MLSIATPKRTGKDICSDTRSSRSLREGVIKLMKSLDMEFENANLKVGRNKLFNTQNAHLEKSDIIEKLLFESGDFI